MASARWLVSSPIYPDALRLLLDHLTAKRTLPETKIHVNGRSDFGIGWGGIPTTETHLMSVLADKGFVPFQHWLIMTADITPFADHHVPLAALDLLHLQWSINALHLEANLNLYADETLVGECQSWGIPPEFAACHDVDRWMEIEWLGVEEPYRRHGLARRLMQEQFRYHARHGVRYCLAYTEVDNIATQALNASLGFTTNAEVRGWLWPYKP